MTTVGPVFTPKSDLFSGAWISVDKCTRATIVSAIRDSLMAQSGVFIHIDEIPREPLMYKANIADEPSIPDLLALLDETMGQIDALNQWYDDRALIELKRHIVLAIAELSVSTQQPYPVSLPGILPLTPEQKGRST